MPDYWKGAYNVRLTREVIINPAEINTQPIKFYSSPSLRALEKRFGTLEREVGSPINTSSEFLIEGRPASGFEYKPFSTGDVETSSKGAGVKETFDIKNTNPPKGDSKGDEAEKLKNKRSNRKLSVRKDSRAKRSRRIKKRRSPVEYPYSFTILDSNHTFDTNQIGGDIIFSNITSSVYDDVALRDSGLESAENVSFQIVTDTKDEFFPTHYTASIADLVNSKTAVVNTPFTKQNKDGEYIALPLSATSL